MKPNILKTLDSVIDLCSNSKKISLIISDKDFTNAVDYINNNMGEKFYMFYDDADEMSKALNVKESILELNYRGVDVILYSEK